ncbi:hypothetical protein MCEMSE6_00531 [Oxalobacteraceae bacterium]
MTASIDNALTPATVYKPCLNFYQQMDVISQARLSLSLRAPDDEMTLEEKNELYEEQRIRILNFVELLHVSLITEHGKVLLCLYQCE